MDYNRVYREFEKHKNAKEFYEYCSELEEIKMTLDSVPFDSIRANQICSFLASKYEADINQLSGKSGGIITVIKGVSLPKKTEIELVADLHYFQRHIPVFALNRQIKSEAMKVLLGLS